MILLDFEQFNNTKDDVTQRSHSLGLLACGHLIKSASFNTIQLSC
jgi:hypothetical protein